MFSALLQPRLFWQWFRLVLQQLLLPVLFFSLDMFLIEWVSCLLGKR